MKLKVGILGLGRGVAFAHVLRLMPDAQVTAVCDADEARLAKFEEHRGEAKLLTRYEDLLNTDVDMVVVASAGPQHADHSIMALEAGKHVISEVPAVSSLEEAPLLLRAARRARGKYFFAENCCYWYFVEAWREWALQGKLGKIIYGEAEYIHDCRHKMRDAAGLTWRAKMPPLKYATHSLGPLLKIMGGRCVSAVGMHTEVNVAPQLNAIDMEVGLFRHDSGAVIKVLCGFSVEREPLHHYYVLYGTQGSVEKSRFDNRTMAHLKNDEQFRRMATTPFEINHPSPPAGATAGGHGTCEFYMVRDFFDALREGRPSPIDVAQALTISLPGICAHLSAEQGSGPVEIPDFHDA